MIMFFRLSPNVPMGLSVSCYKLWFVLVGVEMARICIYVCVQTVSVLLFFLK